MKTEIDSMSEYEAEIKRLRSKNIAFEARADYFENAARSFAQELKKYETQIANLKADFNSLQESYKQAQIDVLNELKKKTHNYYPSIDSYCISQHIVLVRDIDELIEEIEK